MPLLGTSDLSSVDFGVLNNQQPFDILHIFKHLSRQPANQLLSQLVSVQPFCPSTHSQSSHIGSFIHPPSIIPFTRLHRINCSIIYPSSINSLYPSSSINLTISPIPFNHSNNKFNIFVPIYLPSSPWQIHLPHPNPPSKLQQHQSNWERTSV